MHFWMCDPREQQLWDRQQELMDRMQQQWDQERQVGGPLGIIISCLDGSYVCVCV